jgi:hypothetical protein
MVEASSSEGSAHFRTCSPPSWRSQESRSERADTGERTQGSNTTMDKIEAEDGYTVVKEPEGTWAIVRNGTIFDFGFPTSDDALLQVSAYRAEDKLHRDKSE